MQDNSWILKEAKRAKRNGIDVDVEGIPYKNMESEEFLLILKKDSYMLDYEGDMIGKIVALHINKVSHSEKPSYKSLRCNNNY